MCSWRHNIHGFEPVLGGQLRVWFGYPFCDDKWPLNNERMVSSLDFERLETQSEEIMTPDNSPSISCWAPCCNCWEVNLPQKPSGHSGNCAGLFVCQSLSSSSWGWTWVAIRHSHPSCSHIHHPFPFPWAPYLFPCPCPHHSRNPCHNHRIHHRPHHSNPAHNPSHHQLLPNPCRNHPNPLFSGSIWLDHNTKRRYTAKKKDGWREKWKLKYSWKFWFWCEVHVRCRSLLSHLL